MDNRVEDTRNGRRDIRPQGKRRHRVSAHSWRTWSWLLVAITLALGVADLLVLGWRTDARLLLLTSVVIAALAVSRWAGRVILGVSALTLVLYVMLAALFHVQDTATVEWVGGVAVFVALGVLTLWMSRRLEDRSEDALAQARQEARSLAKTVLDTRFDALQTANQRLQHQTQLLASALTVAHTLSGTYDVTSLLNAAVDAISEQFGFPMVAVHVFDDAREWLSLRSASSLEGKALALRGLRLRCGGNSAVGRVAAEGRPLAMAYVDRQQQETGYLANLGMGDIRSTATLPLMVGQHRMGVLDVHMADVALPPEEDLALLVKLADLLALAIDGAKRISDGGGTLETTGLIYRTATRLATASSEREVCRTLLSAIGDFQPVRALVIEASAGDALPTNLLAPGRGHLRVLAELRDGSYTYASYDLAEANTEALSRTGAYVLPPSLVDVVILGLALDAPVWIWDLSDLDPALSPELRGALEGVSDSLVGGVLLGPVLDSQGSNADTARPMIEQHRGSQLGAMALVPIHMDGAAGKGSVLVLYEGIHVFSASERRLHQLLTDLGGAALRRSRLIDEARQGADREALVLSVSERLQRSLDPEAILRIAAAELGSALNAEAVTIEVSPTFDDAAYGTSAAAGSAISIGAGAEDGSRP